MSQFFTGVTPVSQNLTGVTPVGQNLTGVTPVGQNLTGVTPVGQNLTGVTPFQKYVVVAKEIWTINSKLVILEQHFRLENLKMA